MHTGGAGLERVVGALVHLRGPEDILRRHEVHEGSVAAMPPLHTIQLPQENGWHRQQTHSTCTKPQCHAHAMQDDTSRRMGVV